MFHCWDSGLRVMSTVMFWINPNPECSVFVSTDQRNFFQVPFGKLQVGFHMAFFFLQQWLITFLNSSNQSSIKPSFFQLGCGFLQLLLSYSCPPGYFFTKICLALAIRSMHFYITTSSVGGHLLLYLDCNFLVWPENKIHLV